MYAMCIFEKQRVLVFCPLTLAFPMGPLVQSQQHKTCHPVSRSYRLKTAESDSLFRYNQATNILACVCL